MIDEYDDILFGLCSKCGSTKLVIYFTENTLGAFCSVCKGLVFETDNLKELLDAVKDKSIPTRLAKAEKKRTIN